jgi:hypothetical protein
MTDLVAGFDGRGPLMDRGAIFDGVSGRPGAPAKSINVFCPRTRKPGPLILS